MYLLEVSKNIKTFLLLHQIKIALNKTTFRERDIKVNVMFPIFEVIGFLEGIYNYKKTRNPWNLITQFSPCSLKNSYD